VIVQGRRVGVDDRRGAVGRRSLRCRLQGDAVGQGTTVDDRDDQPADRHACHGGSCCDDLPLGVLHVGLLK
jgi:hypothetical protein